MNIYRTDTELINAYTVRKNYIDSLAPDEVIDLTIYEEYKMILDLIKFKCNLSVDFEQKFKKMTEG